MAFNYFGKKIPCRMYDRVLNTLPVTLVIDLREGGAHGEPMRL